MHKISTHIYMKWDKQFQQEDGIEIEFDDIWILIYSFNTCTPQIICDPWHITWPLCNIVLFHYLSPSPKDWYLLIIH